MAASLSTCSPTGTACATRPGAPRRRPGRPASAVAIPARLRRGRRRRRRCPGRPRIHRGPCRLGVRCWTERRRAVDQRVCRDPRPVHQFQRRPWRCRGAGPAAVPAQHAHPGSPRRDESTALPGRGVDWVRRPGTSIVGRHAVAGPDEIPATRRGCRPRSIWPGRGQSVEPNPRLACGPRMPLCRQRPAGLTDQRLGWRRARRARPSRRRAGDPRLKAGPRPPTGSRLRHRPTRRPRIRR